MSKIYQSICAIISDLGAVGKGKKNQQQNFQYRGVDDIMNALNPLLSKHKVFIVPEVIEQSRNERQTAKGGTLLYSICTIRYTFYAEDGSNISAVVVGEGMDSGDKATNKAMAIAFKYVCFQVFCVATEEVPDPDAETPPPSKPNRKQLLIGQKHLDELTTLVDGDVDLAKKVIGNYGYEKSSQITLDDFPKIIVEIKELKGVSELC